MLHGIGSDGIVLGSGERATLDINGDGYDDIVMHSLFPNPQKGVPFEHLVFLNNRDGTFRDFSDESGLRRIQAGFFAFGDIDNDGDQDAFAGLDIPLAGQTHAILLNDGQGHFTPKAGSGVCGVQAPWAEPQPAQKRASSGSTWRQPPQYTGLAAVCVAPQAGQKRLADGITA